MSPFTSLIQHNTGSPSHSNQTRRRNKKNVNWKGRSKTVIIFADDMILYIKNPKDSTKKVLELINEFSKVAGQKINIQKSVAFLYADNKLSEREIKGIKPFAVASKRIKYLGINLTKDAKDLYLVNYKTMKKIIADDTNKWKHGLCLVYVHG